MPSPRANKLLSAMRANPRGDWKIDDVANVCRQLGIILHPGGRHFVASSPLLAGHLAIPAKRPIKPIYIKLFAKMCDAHIALTGEQ